MAESVTCPGCGKCVGHVPNSKGLDRYDLEINHLDRCKSEAAKGWNKEFYGRCRKTR